MIVKIDEVINHFSCLPERGDILPVDALGLEVSDHRQIEDALTSLDAGDSCHPLGIGFIRVKLPVQQVFIPVHLLSYLPPLPRSTPCHHGAGLLYWYQRERGPIFFVCCCDFQERPRATLFFFM